jgi:hypothetical protein
VEFFRVKVKIGKNPADFPVFSFGEDHPQGFSAHPFNFLSPVQYPVDSYPPAKFGKDLIRDDTRRFSQILLFYFRPGMTGLGGKIPVVGKKNEPRRTEIQTAHVVEPFRYVPGQQILCQGPALGVEGTAYIEGGLVQDQIPETAFGLNPDPVKAYLIPGLHLFPQSADPPAIQGYPAFQD